MSSRVQAGSQKSPRAFTEGIEWRELVIQVMDETEKPTRGQGDNWKISKSWMSLPSLAWRDCGREEVNSQSPQAGVTSNIKVATAVNAAQDRKVVRNTLASPFLLSSSLLPVLPIGQTQLSVSDMEAFLPYRAGGEVGRMEPRSFRPGLCYVNEPKKTSVCWPLDSLFTAGWTP